MEMKVWEELKCGGSDAAAEPDTYEHFVIRNRVCAEPVPVKGDAIRGCARVHGVDLSGEQAVLDAPEASYDTQAGIFSDVRQHARMSGCGLQSYSSISLLLPT